MVTINGNQLTIEQVVQVARQNDPVVLDPGSRANIEQANHWIQEIIMQGKPVYGINTGFGIFADRLISDQDAALLSRNLILSHAVGTGDALPVEVVRAAMLIRANTLAKGNSGVRPIVIDTLLDMLNKGVTPVIPSQGSLGSSGDLAPLSHLALVFTTDQEAREEDTGYALYDGQQLSGKAAMQAAGLQPIILGPKEGLAVSNGATFSAAIAALAIADAFNLLSTASITLSMSLEALKGVSTAFDERLHAVRPHPGQIGVADTVRDLIYGSTLIDSEGRVQDAYSLRCAPQVQGSAADALDFIQAILQREINAATDNPLLFAEGIALSGGNFHGEPIGMAMDFLGIALAEIAGISERRIFRLTDGKLNADLPPMLVDSHQAAGLNSGMMMPQYTAASLVLENQTLASPDSVYSLPTSAEQEDHNANSMTAARHARQIVANTTHVLTIEAYTAARALDIRIREIPTTVLGAGTSAAHQLIRDHVPYQAGDAWWAPEIEIVKSLIISGEFARTVWGAIDGIPHS
jgi:histidine ammonia-lyase